jgi:hypothetical protein
MDKSTLAAPIARASRRRQRRWNEHWPLPLAFVLALGFWFYLDSRISTDRSYRCRIVTDRDDVNDPIGENDGVLQLRVPDGYTISSVRAGNRRSGAELDAEDERESILLDFYGPKSEIQALDTRLTFFVDLTAPNEGGGADRSTRRFSKSDISASNASLLRYLAAMVPEELQVVLEASGSAQFTLSPGSVVIRYPDPREEWSRRVFLETLQFDPPLVRVRGPRERLDQLQGSGELFELDVSELSSMSERLLPREEGSGRPRISFPVRLRPRFASELTLLDPHLTASVEIAPPAWTSDEFEVRIAADWQSSSLDPAVFQLDRHSIKFRIRSYDPRLTRLLREGGRAWVRRWMRAVADIGRIPAETDTSDPRFSIAVDPLFFYLGDEHFVLGKHYEIDVTEPLFLSRK